jgi:HrpA-like RNA helicase
MVGQIECKYIVAQPGAAEDLMQKAAAAAVSEQQRVLHSGSCQLHISCQMTLQVTLRHTPYLAAAACALLQMDWAAQQHVNDAAPSHLQLPTGSTAAIDYNGAQPSAAVKMQEVFGLAGTPLLGGQARVPLLLELLSPAGRPLQVRLRLCGC